MSKLSELVAVRVMGGQPGDYDTCFANAMRVVENLRARRSENGERWRVAIRDAGDKWIVDVEDWKARVDVSAWDDGVCVAICIAALRACGVPESEIEEARKQ